MLVLCIALWNDDGTPVSGEVTDAVLLWDAGTEQNEEPGVGREDKGVWCRVPGRAVSTTDSNDSA